jgi:hypothetical protein
VPEKNPKTDTAKVKDAKHPKNPKHPKGTKNLGMVKCDNPEHNKQASKKEPMIMGDIASPNEEKQPTPKKKEE